MTEQPRDAQPFGSLTLVLPAFNEESRLGPALDELFGYLRRRGGPPREGAPASANLPDRIRVLVVDDGSSDGTAALVRQRPEAAPEVREAGSSGPWRGAWLDLLSVPHGGKGAAVKAGMLAADSDVVVFADADMATPPDQLPGLVEALGSADVALGSRIQSDGSDMRRTQPGFRRLLGKLFHALAAIWVTGSCSRHAMRVQGVLAGRRPGLVRAAGDHEHRVRRRAHLPRPSARLPHRSRADPVVRPSRFADADATTPGGPRGLGPLSDPVPPSPDRSPISVTRGPTRLGEPLATGSRPIGPLSAQRPPIDPVLSSET